MFFGTDLGVISSSLRYERMLDFSLTQMLVNLAVIIVFSRKSRSGSAVIRR